MLISPLPCSTQESVTEQADDAIWSGDGVYSEAKTPGNGKGFRSSKFPGSRSPGKSFRSSEFHGSKLHV